MRSAVEVLDIAFEWNDENDARALMDDIEARTGIGR